MFLQLLQRNADYRPDSVAIAYGDAHISHRQLLDRVESLARSLKKLGVQPGDRVALFLQNSPDFITGFFAVAACRAVNVPLNTDYKADEAIFYVNDARVKCIITDAARTDSSLQIAANAGHDVKVISTADDPKSAIAFADLLTEDSDEPLPNGALDDYIVYMYTSGSTGRPKCAPRTVIQYWWEMDDVIECLKIDRHDVIFCAIPLFHNFAAVQCMLVLAGTGAKLVILKNPTPFVLRRKEALKRIESERATLFPCVPYVVENLAECTGEADLTSVRICYSGSAVLSRETSDLFKLKYGIPVRDHYGCTEIGAMTLNLDSDPSEHSDSVGTPLPGVRIRIIDESENELPVGSCGEIVVSSRSMTGGYLGVDAAGNSMFRNGAFYTGDLGRVDEEGRLYLMGRKKFIIDVAGQKVSPIEVEDVLETHALVRHSIVIGVPNPNGKGEVIQAYVVAGEGCTERELIALCRERLANFKTPQFIKFISEVPKSTLGKVIRKKEELDRVVIQLEMPEQQKEVS